MSMRAKDMSVHEYQKLMYQRHKQTRIEESKLYYQIHKDDPEFIEKKNKRQRNYRFKNKLKELGNRATNSDLTSRPRLFAPTYWGRTKAIEFYENLNPNEIHLNRNKFIEDYNIERRQKFTKNIQKTLEELDSCYNDHPEAYKSKDGYYIIIVSPYKSPSNEKTPEGWEEIYPLYLSGARTFLRKIMR